LDALRECLKSLPDRSRGLLRMRYEQGLPSAAIARRTESTLDAVYQTLSRIRARLEDCIRMRLAAAEKGA
jgi:RNA polymerase sigma-70 factor (ECF subfamily)